MTCRFILFMAVFLAAPAHAAQAAPPVAKQVSDLQACRAMSDSTARLACYDRAVDALSAATASQDVVIVERSEVRKARKGLFGFLIPKIGLLAGREGSEEDEADVNRLDTKVVTSRVLPYGNWRFTVEGGAVWDTLETSFSFIAPLPGRPVLIEKGSLGSFSARVGKGGWVRVKRIQ
jgi:hypothetical protein